MSKLTSVRAKAVSLLHLLIWLYGIASLFFTWLFYFIVPDNAVFAFIRSGYLLALIPSIIICLIISIFTKNRLLIFLLLPNLLLVLAYTIPYFTPSFVTTQEQDIAVKVFSYNMLNLGDEDSLDTIADLIREENPDIIALQELSRPGNAGLIERLGSDYPYVATDLLAEWWQTGQGIYTRYPIIEETSWVDEDLNMTHPHQRLLLDVDGAEVAFYNIHPYPPIEWQGGLHFIVNESDLSAHSIAMHRIITSIELETVPVLVAGDMNMSDQFPEYRRLSNLLTDSFKDAGFGLGFTYPANSSFPKLIRLDYIFHSDEFDTVNARVLRDTHTSDHLPVVARMVLQGE